MTTAFTILSLCVAGYRIRKGLFTKLEWVLLSLWAGHVVLEELQLIAYVHRFYYSARFMRPAECLLWGWLAWGIVHLKRLWKYALIAGALIVVYDGVLLVKAQLPIGRRGAYVAATNWAAEKIKADWPTNVRRLRENGYVFDLGEYRTGKRPVVDCHTARVAYLVDGRTNGIDTDERTAMQDQADYWIQDLRTDDPPGEGWELMGTFKRGKYELPLYKRIGGDER